MVISFPHRAAAVAADATYQGIAATSVTISFETFDGVPVPPCFDCVPGVTGTVTFGAPYYLLGLPGGHGPLYVTLMIEDTDYTGPCSGVFELLQDSVPAHYATQAIPGGCVAGTDYLLSWETRFRAGTSTSGLLKGGVEIGDGSSVISAVEEPLVISTSKPLPHGIAGPASITIGVPVSGPPCVNCAPSFGDSATLSVPTPLFIVPRDEALMVTLYTVDFTYLSGLENPCTLFYQIKLGTTVVAGGKRTSPDLCRLDQTNLSTWNLKLPSGTPAGPAILSGGVIAGSNTYAMFQPILIQ